MNRLLYILELVLLLPFFPYLYWKGKRLRTQVQRLPQHSNYLHLKTEQGSKKLLVIGESTAAGVGASGPEKTFAACLFEQGQVKFSVLNLGKNGLKAGGLNRLLAHAKPDIPASFDQVIILIGANDCFKFTPPNKFYQELSRFIDIFEGTETTQTILIPTIPPVNHFPAIPYILRLFLGVHRYILTQEIQKLDKKISKLQFIEWKSGFTADFFASDGIHPSDLGYQIMAQEAFKQLKGDPATATL